MFEPLIKIKHFDVSLPDLDVYDGVIITSPHAKKSLPENHHCYSVGDYAPTAIDLASRIIQENLDKKLRLLYIRGKDIAFDIKATLKTHHIDELISYEAIASESLSLATIDAFKNHEIGVITFFSKRTAEIFVKLAIQHDILDDLKGIKALCISNSVVECLHSIFGDNIKVSDYPDAQGISRMIK